MTIYFLGICGTAMGQAAVLLRQLGYEVCGCDEKTYPPMSIYLEQEGIQVYSGFDAQRLKDLNPDYVVVGNALTRGNPEVEWLLETEAFEMLSLPELIKEFLMKNRKRIVISGTHGKTTTSSLCAYLLKANAIETGYLIGGLAEDLSPRAALGASGGPFVIEGDEYDSAFFDKRSKFIHYRPHLLGITSIELDHIDIFRDIEDVLRSFRHLVRLLPASGALVINGDDERCQALLPVPWTRVYQVGTQAHNDLQIKSVESNPERPGTRFELWWQGALWERLDGLLLGLHNARNAAMAALLAQLALGDAVSSPSLNLLPLNTFRGVKRRAQCLFQGPDCLVFEDFAHHPSALELTLKALAQAYPYHKLWACFDPRCNSTRTRRFQPAIEAALAHAHRAWIGPVDRPHQLKDTERLDPQGVAHALTRSGIPAYASPSHPELLEHLLQAHSNAQERHLICFFTNGAFGGLPQHCAEWVRASSLSPKALA